MSYVNVKPIIDSMLGTDNPTKEQVRELLLDPKTIEEFFSVANNPEGNEIDLGFYKRYLDAETCQKMYSIYLSLKDKNHMPSFLYNNLFVTEIGEVAEGEEEEDTNETGNIPTTVFTLNVLQGRLLDEFLQEMHDAEEALNDVDNPKYKNRKLKIPIIVNGEEIIQEEKIDHHYMVKAMYRHIKWSKNKVIEIKNYILSKFNGNEKEFNEWLNFDRVLKIKFNICEPDYYDKENCATHDDWTKYIPQRLYLMTAQALTQILYKLKVSQSAREKMPELAEKGRYGDIYFETDSTGEFASYLWAYYNIQVAYQSTAMVCIANNVNNTGLTVAERSKLILQNLVPNGLKLGDYLLFSGCNFSDFCSKSIVNVNEFRYTVDNYTAAYSRNAIEIDRHSFFVARVVAIRYQCAQYNNNDGVISLCVNWKSKDGLTQSIVNVPISSLIPNMARCKTQAMLNNLLVELQFSGCRESSQETAEEQCIKKLISVLTNVPMILHESMLLEFQHPNSSLSLPATDFIQVDEYTLAP